MDSIKIKDKKIWSYSSLKQRELIYAGTVQVWSAATRRRTPYQKLFFRDRFNISGAMNRDITVRLLFNVRLVDLLVDVRIVFTPPFLVGVAVVKAEGDRAIDVHLLEELVYKINTPVVVHRDA